MFLSIQDVRALKGAALSIFVLGLLDPQPHSASWYARMSGYSDKPVTQALQLLVEYGTMVRSMQGWMIAIDTQEKLSTGYPQVNQKSLQNRKNSDSSLNSSSSSHKRNSFFLLKKEEERRSEKFRSCLKACHSAGIMGTKAEVIAQLDHVTPNFITSHVKMAKAQGHTLGTAISRIEQGWEVPNIQSQDTKNKYESGPYAAYID